MGPPARQVRHLVERSDKSGNDAVHKPDALRNAK
jgi:hypothetical protein